MGCDNSAAEVSSGWQFGSPSDSDSDNDALPYPEPLARNAFLTPEFTPTEFLSSLRNRHQTLEDLRSELRTRSQELSKELLDLVNDNYEEFLGLGNDLRGGDEKVEEVRVGLLGFRREIDALREKTAARRQEAADHVAERQDVVRDLRIGRDLLEINSRLEDLERSLQITPKPNGSKFNYERLEDMELSDESGSDSDDERSTILLSRIRRRVQQYLDMQRLVKRVGSEHPFLTAQQTRSQRVKQTLLLDLSNTMKQCQRDGNNGKMLKALQLYDRLDEAQEAISVVRTMGRS